VQRPRLLAVTSTFPGQRGDGTPAFVWDLAEQVARHFDTVVLAPMVPGAARQERVGPLEIHRFRYFPRRWEDLADGAILENLRARPSRWLQVPAFLLAEALALRRLVRAFGPDVLHVHWVLPQGVVAAFAVPGWRWVLTAHGADVYALTGRLGNALKRAALRRAAVVTAPNQDMRHRLVQLGGDPSTTLVMPMGADVAAIQAGGGHTRTRPGRLLFVGRLVDKKGVAVLLQALRGAALGSDWSLEVIGDGPAQARLAEEARLLDGEVRFTGTVDRAGVAAAMAACEVFVLPSLPAGSGDQDGLPVVLLEAMAAGCAIVASRMPGIEEVLGGGDHGLLVPPGDPEALRAALVRLLRDPELRAKLGASAVAAATAYSVELVGEGYARLLASVADNGAVGHLSGRDRSTHPAR
jgi:colanic acid/amylovoran biosynthesis glycosyltransferase